ncbi:hypothetical protein [Streptomyces sp. NPDC050355]|uniref:hypothetical protein n=1 Tax=Streptomyces sp. NPDC050355 TaxID=3365609 RepID=UPI0037876949
MNATSDAPIAELAAAWEEVRAEYYADHDTELVLACARALVADPGGERAWLWTFGLLMTADYVTLQSASDGTAAAVLDALRATDRELRRRPCAHDGHPYEGDLDEQLPRLVSYLPLLEHGAPPAGEADRDGWHCAEVWRCPRNVAGYARVAIDILAPGTTDAVPARLSTAEQEEVGDLASLLDGHPAPGVSVSWSLSHYGKALAAATEPAERAGLVVIVTALSRYAVGLVDGPGPLNDLIAGLASVPAAPAEGRCGHGAAAHPVLPEAPEDVLTAGMRLKSPSGRRLLAERGGRPGEGAPLEAWLCPAFVAELARASLKRVRAAREELFGALGSAR